MQIIERNIADLIRAEYNPRELTQDQEKQLSDSLRRFGVVDPVIVNVHEDRKDIIIGGHQRSKVWQKLGNDTIPTVELSLTLDQEKELNVRLNKNTGQFDMEMLKDHFETDDLIEWGFTDVELEWQEDVTHLEAEEDDFEVPEEVHTDIVQGDLIEIGPHRLLCGDSTNSDDVEKLMDGQKADMVFTDPPYNVAFNGRSGKHDVIMNDDLDDVSFKDLIDGTIASIKLLDPMHYYIWCNWKFYGVLQDSLEYKSCIVWAKNVFGLGRGYRHQHEFCLYNGKIDDGINNESDLWEIAKDSKYMHPTQKPVALSARALGNHKQAINIVDLFGGSGSTLAGVHQLKRKGFMMELDPKYCQVIVDRMMKLDSSLSVKINGKDYGQE
jgi:DNA modification methylase